MNVVSVCSARRGVLVLLAAAMLILAACSSSGGRPTPATTGASPTPQASATPAYGTPIAPPPTPLPIPRSTADASTGIGVYPTSLGFPDTLRGREYYRTVGVINGGPSDQKYRFETSGDTAGWLTFVGQDRTTPIQEVDVAPGGRAQVLVKALVPPSVPNGDYGGTISVLTTATVRGDAKSSGAGVTLGAEVNVLLAVTGTQKIEGQFIEAAASDVESGYPLRIATHIANTGNVQLNPTIDVDITDAAGQPVDHFTSTDQILYPSDNKEIVLEWDTTGRAIGERLGRVSVKLGSLDLGTKDIRFKIVPPGTFTRNAELDAVRLVNKPRAGDYAKLIAVFKNTGQIQTKGKFVGELYLGNRLIGQLTSPEDLLLPGGSGDLEVLVRVPKNGTYRVTGKINYEGRETPVREYVFRIGSEGGPPWFLIGASAAGAAVIVLAAAAGMWRWRRRGRTAS